jgi:AcrR family transcriptional regulator
VNLPRTRTRARRGEGARLRDDIVDAAERLLMERGDEDLVSIRDIADAVGVTPPSIYLHFADKDALLLAVCERQFALLHEHLQQAEVGVDDPLEALGRRGRAYVEFGLEHPDAYRIMFMGRPHREEHHVDTVERAGMQAFASHVAAVQRAADAGRLRPGTDVVAAAIFLWTCVHGITSLLISLAKFPWPERDPLIASLCAASLRGLTAADPAA